MKNFYTNISRAGNTIYIKEYNPEIGKHEFNKVEFQPTLFVPSNKPSKFKGLDGINLEPIKPGTIRETQEFIKEYKDVNNFQIYGNTNYVVQFISETYHNMDYDLSKISVSNIDIEVDTDGEFPKPEEALFPINAMTVYNSDTNTFHVLALHCKDSNEPEPKWDVSKSYIADHIKDEKIEYQVFENESSLLSAFLALWSSSYPDIVTGWNIEAFDIPYIYNRIVNVLGEKEARKLSPYGIIFDRQVKDNFGNRFTTYDFLGVSILDYILLYKKYTYKAQESYSLDHISYVELKEKKLSYEESGSLFKLYRNNFQKFIDYNIKDVVLVRKIDNKMKLLDLVATVAYYAGINFADTFSPVKTWDTIIYTYLLEKNIIVPPNKQSSKKESFEGAYVKDPQVGFSDWVMSFDLNSLYPHLIMQYNLGPETLIELEDLPQTIKTSLVYGKTIKVDDLVEKRVDLSSLKGHKICMSANGQFFRTDEKSFLSVMMDSLYKERKANKKTMLKFEQELVHNPNSQDLKNNIAKFNNLQMAQKILLNSAYGAIGNPYFRFYDLRIAEAVTLSGQLSIKWIARKFNEYLNGLLKTENKDYVVAIDTDSNYITFGDLVDKVFKDKTDVMKIVNFLDKVAKEKIEPFVQDSYGELADYVNAYENKMFMGREVIAERGVWTGKKRYMLKVWDSEGVRYEKPKLKIMGLEAKKSSTPEHCREKLVECYHLVLSKDEAGLQNLVKKWKRDFKKLPPEQVATPSSANNIQEYSDTRTIYRKATPAHVKGVLIYNHLVRKMQDHSIPQIQMGEKVKWTYLKTPNKIKESVIAFPNFLDKKLGLHSYVDYDKMFEKNFIKPLSGVLDAVKWSHERKRNLNDLIARAGEE